MPRMEVVLVRPRRERCAYTPHELWPTHWRMMYTVGTLVVCVAAVGGGGDMHVRMGEHAVAPVSAHVR